MDPKCVTYAQPIGPLSCDIWLGLLGKDSCKLKTMNFCRCKGDGVCCRQWRHQKIFVRASRGQNAYLRGKRNNNQKKKKKKLPKMADFCHFSFWRGGGASGGRASDGVGAANTPHVPPPLVPPLVVESQSAHDELRFCETFPPSGLEPAGIRCDMSDRGKRGRRPRSSSNSKEKIKIGQKMLRRDNDCHGNEGVPAAVKGRPTACTSYIRTWHRSSKSYRCGSYLWAYRFFFFFFFLLFVCLFFYWNCLKDISGEI